MRLLGRVPEGQEVFISYGRDKSNEDWLFFHGFAFDANPADTAQADASRPHRTSASLIFPGLPRIPHPHSEHRQPFVSPSPVGIPPYCHPCSSAMA